MDWTMVSNAREPIDRVRTIFYLYGIRYEVTAHSAGQRLAREKPDNLLCRQSIDDVRTELACPSGKLGMVHVSDTEVREYLRALIAAHDEEIRVLE
jgi:hypothetical protein